MSSIQNIFIIGSKGIPARYGGFETFVDNLTFYRKSPLIQYHIACLIDSKKYDSNMKTFEYNNAKCFNIKAHDIGPAKAILYDLEALRYCINYIKKNGIQSPIIYVLACRIGPFINHYKRILIKLGGYLIVNPDGHEWLRSKWSYPVRKYWKISEKLMIKHSDIIICDSKNIEKYIRTNYSNFKPKTEFIAYGADISKSKLTDEDSEFARWCIQHKLKHKNYFLVVGRFVPENNFETMIIEFMKSKTNKDLVFITGVTRKFLTQLIRRTGFNKDPRVKFVGTIYNQELLKKIRENAYGYLHGHEVGGTNPSLLEALSSTEINLLYDVNFNREVGEDGAIYWTKEEGNLANTIDKADKMSNIEISLISSNAKRRIIEMYNWNSIVRKYEELFSSIKSI